MDDLDAIPELPNVSSMHPELLDIDGPVPELPDMTPSVESIDSLPPPPLMSIGKGGPLPSEEWSPVRSAISGFSRGPSEMLRQQLDATSEGASELSEDSVPAMQQRFVDRTGRPQAEEPPLPSRAPRRAHHVNELPSSDMLHCPMTGSPSARTNSASSHGPGQARFSLVGSGGSDEEKGFHSAYRPNLLKPKSPNWRIHHFDRSASAASKGSFARRIGLHLRDNESIMSGGTGRSSPNARSVFPAPSHRGTVISSGSGGRSSMPSKRHLRKGGGGIIGNTVAKRARRFISKTNPPTYEKEDADKYGVLVTNTWAKVLDLTGYLDFGRIIYDEIFEEDGAPDLQAFFEERDPDQTAALFANMVESIVSFASDPVGLHQRLEELAQTHMKNSVMPIHFITFGHVLLRTLLSVLGEHIFTKEAEEAWQWVWGMSNKSYAVLHNAASSSGSLVAISWDIACENCTEEEIGQTIYSKMFQLAPHMRSLFSKPKEVMALKLTDMVSVLVSFADDRKKMEEEVSALGMRHVKVGMKPAHVPMMGQALLETVAAAVGPDWNPEMEKGWQELWQTTADMMMRTVELGQLHGPVIENLWANVKKKANAQEKIGKGIFSALSQTDPHLANLLCPTARTPSTWMGGGHRRADGRRCSAEWSINDVARPRKMSMEAGLEGGEEGSSHVIQRLACEHLSRISERKIAHEE